MAPSIDYPVKGGSTQPGAQRSGDREARFTGKTDNSKGTMEVPEDIRPFLLRQAQGKSASRPCSGTG